MRFISVRQLATTLKLAFSRIDDGLIRNLRKAVEQHFVEANVLPIADQSFTFEELVFILDQLKEEQVRVFYEWIFHDITLSEYLMSMGETILPNEEIILSKEHQLFEGYQIFLSTYLAPILIQKTALGIKEEDLAFLESHLKFSQLLPKEKRIEIQQPTNLYLRQLLAQLKVSQGVNLQNQLKLVYSYEFVQVLNALDESFYSEAIAYIDSAKLVVLNNVLGPLTLDSIKSAISRVTLNKEHHEQVRKFCNSDAFTAKRKEPRSSLNNIVRSPLFFVSVIAVVINFIFLYPMGKSTQEKIPIEGTKEVDEVSEVDDSVVIICEDSLK